MTIYIGKKFLAWGKTKKFIKKVFLLLFFNMLLKTNAKLVLEDGSIFSGISFGAERSAGGEVVFSTGMVGYPESFTDPSYKGQILCLTYPLIGNYGVPSDEKDAYGLPKYFESDKVHIRGLVISDYSSEYSHWNSSKSLADWLKENKVPAIYGVDTRALTKKLREKGAMLGRMVIENKEAEIYDPNKEDVVREVSIKEPVFFNAEKKTSEIIRNDDVLKQITNEKRKNKTVVLVDCGVKCNIIRNLLKRKLNVIMVPYDYDFFRLKFDGLAISNGPGDPKMCRKTIENVRKAIKEDFPIFGICLGNQLLALAAGANTYKLKYGHRSQNQPCIMEGTKRCFITTQNHGFAVDVRTLPPDWEPLFTNANDNTNEGIRHRKKKIFSSQFHPEAAPGPVDTEFLFDEFVKNLG